VKTEEVSERGWSNKSKQEGQKEEGGRMEVEDTGGSHYTGGGSSSRSCCIHLQGGASGGWRVHGNGEGFRVLEKEKGSK